MGCTNPKSTRYDSEDRLKKAYINVYNMREKMLKLIFGADKRVQLTQMKVAKNKINKVKDTVTKIGASFKYFIAVTDWNTQAVQEKKN